MTIIDRSRKDVEVLKAGLGALIGYVAMMALYYGLSIGSMAIIGIPAAFEGNSWDPSRTWVTFGLVMTLIAALVGGWLGIKVARSEKVVEWMIVLIILSGFITMARQGPGWVLRLEGVSQVEAVFGVKYPPAVQISQIILGMVGVFASSKLRRRSGFGRRVLGS